MLNLDKILEAERECQLRTYRLEREWKRVENRLVIAQLRVERAKEIRVRSRRILTFLNLLALAFTGINNQQLFIRAALS